MPRPSTRRRGFDAGNQVVMLSPSLGRRVYQIDEEEFKKNIAAGDVPSAHSEDEE
jgi:hypothetical protein